ncbi:unnamed protein product [Meloidogyne enterolobii]|uniref:Uncharacterized protein n=1 Tax=Meloidogyne enterolobii TaxID=390850 RepID=A0ACB1AM66_MELEN
MGICLQHMEIFPLPLSRYVLKYILGCNITWYDLAFFDSSLLILYVQFTMRMMKVTNLKNFSINLK